MIARGLRILLALFFLLVASSSGKGSLEQSIPPGQAERFNQSRSLNLCTSKPKQPYQFYLPITFASGSDINLIKGCEIVDQSPPDDAVLPADSPFTMRWAIKNTSGSTWLQESTCARFLSGDRVHTGSDILDLPYSVPQNSLVEIVVSMQAPSTSGTYTSNWALVQNSFSVCRFFVVIKTQ